MSDRAIEDHGIVGDARSAALVARDGSIDWLCWPRFDSPPVFGAILDERLGSWRVAPRGEYRSHAAYEAGTNVLHTTFTTTEGELVLTDLMPVMPESEKRRTLLPEREILRRLRCTRGRVDVEITFTPRPDFGRGRVRLDPRPHGVLVELAGAVLYLRAEVPLRVDPASARVAGSVALTEGQVRWLSLSYTGPQPAVLPALGETAARRVETSVRWWHDWCEKLPWDVPRRDAVVRSALALRLLVYAPSGAIVAAPTTSLPERIGDELNWDYRFCWLRDAAFTVRALVGVGHREEALAFVSWLLGTTRLTAPALAPLYTVHGERPPRERVLAGVAGYRGSRPVRVGNLAAEQRQMDVYGELVDALSIVLAGGGRLDRETRDLLEGFGRYVCDHWDEPDAGIWEPRGESRSRTHSIVLCWVALDRLIGLHEKGLLPGISVQRYRETRATIASTVRERAWSTRLGSYVATLDGDELDASLLQLSWYGFEPAAGERMRGTFAAIREQLAAGDALLYRYRRDPAEGAFLIASAWAIEHLALAGERAEAHRWFEALVDRANDVGLFAEELDPASGAALGNFPQGFTHLGVLNAALSLRDPRVPRRHE